MLHIQTLKEIKLDALENCRIKQPEHCDYDRELSYELCASIDNLIMYCEFTSPQLRELHSYKAVIVYKHDNGIISSKAEIKHLSNLYKTMVKVYKTDLAIAELNGKVNELTESIHELLKM